MLKVQLVGGARPNFMKIAPIYRAALAYSDVDCRIIHTGQHYDYEMSQAFFDDLEIPKPQYFLDAGSGSHAVQTAKIMVSFEEVCVKEKCKNSKEFLTIQIYMLYNFHRGLNHGANHGG